MIDKAIGAIRDYGMLSQGDTLTAGVSGGADSVALLYFLCAIRQEWGIEVSVAHVNHNLRGEESDQDEAFVRALCKKLDVRLAVASLDIHALAAKSHRSIEECAREERYRFFRQLAGEKGKIATAHNLNDNVETQLINLSRGTGLRGLCGIPPVRDNIIRPLIRCTRAEIEAFCREHGLSWMTDSTNLSDDYSRNRLRHHVLPVLRELNPAFLKAAGGAMELLRRDEEYLQAQAEAALQAIIQPDGGYSRYAYLALPQALSGRLLSSLCRERGLPYSQERIALLNQCIRRGSGGVQLSGTCRLRCGKASFWFDRPAAKEPEEPGRSFATIAVKKMARATQISCGPGKTVEILHMNREEFEYLYKNNKNLLINALDCAKIGEIVTLRTRAPGDMFSPRGRGCSKNMKKLFQELEIPQEERSGLPVLAGEDGSLRWVWGAGAGEPYGIDECTQQLLLVEQVEEMECRATSRRS